jgi:hypothetical protein
VGENYQSWQENCTRRSQKALCHEKCEMKLISTGRVTVAEYNEGVSKAVTSSIVLQKEKLI